MTLPNYPEDPNQPYGPPRQSYFGGGMAPGGPAFLPPETPLNQAYDDGTRAVRVLSGAGRRLGARVLDAIILTVGAFVVGGIGFGLGYAIDGDRHDPGPVAITIMVVFGVLAFAWLILYEPFFLWQRGATPGKLAVGIRVVRTADGRNWPSFGMSLWRYVFQFLIGLVPFGGLVDVLWLLWDRPLHQCLHDKVASTVVIRK